MIEVITRAAIIVDGKALLVQAKGDTRRAPPPPRATNAPRAVAGAASTFLPGGHVEPGEAVVDALRRELDEEIGAGANCSIGAPLGVVEHAWLDDAQGPPRKRFEINHVFRVTLPDVDPAHILSREASLALLWCPLADLEGHHLLPVPMRAILRLAAEGPPGEAFASTLHECTFAAPRPCEVRRVRASDVGQLRAARLYALAETPTAFGVTLARDLAQAHDKWLAWATERDMDEKPDAKPLRRATFVADDGDRLRATVTVAEGNDDDDDDDDGGTRAHVFAMWVHPTHRTRTSSVHAGLAQRMLDAAVAWAREQRFARVSLAVTTNNDRARRLYERYGFVPTGNQWPLQHTPSLSLHELVYPLT